MRKSVLVLNHFAVPRGMPGGTRHIDLFSRLDGWSYLIVASRLNHLTGEKQQAAHGFRPVAVTPYRANGWRRILNWVSYAVGAFCVSIRQRRVDVVYASSPHLLAALAGWLVAFLRRKPLVLEIRDLWPRVLVDMGQMTEKSPIFRVLTALENFLYARANHIVVLAEGTRTELERRGISPDKIVYIPNGSDPDDFSGSADRETLRSQFGFTRFTAVYAGAHGPANGLSLLLDAASQLECEELDILLVGGGVSKTGLVEIAEQRGLTNVRFLDPIPKDEVPELLRAADLGLHVLADVELFRTAVSPNKVFDYMAAGLPILTNCPGLVTDLVIQANCGIAVPPNGLTNGLRKALVSDLDELGDNGARWIAANQSLEIMADRLDSVLNRSI